MASYKVLLLVNLSLLLNLTKSEEPPNIILMNLDDFGWGDLGVMGNPARETPNLDGMAATGLLHTDFYAAAAICSPSRASLLTGRLPLRNGFYQNTFPGRNAYTPQEIVGGIASAEVLIPELLLKAGYHTKIIGKWHLGHQEQYLPLEHGFQEWFGAPNCHFKYNVAWKKGPNIPVYRNRNMVGRYYEDFAIDISKGASNFTQLLVQEALEYVTRDNVAPYFLYWAPDSSHAPSYSSKQFRGSSSRDSFYGDAIKEIDDGVGKILSAVRQSKRQTLVVFTSDNGAALVSRELAGSNGPLRCGKQTTFEGGFRVPTISWWSQGGPRGVSHYPGSHLDLLPTFAELAGVDIPHNLELDGTSISTVFKYNKMRGLMKPVFFYRGNLLYAVRFNQHKAHFFTWATPTEELNKGIDFCAGVNIVNFTTTSITLQDPPILFNLGRDPGESYPINHNTQEYKENVELIYSIARKHRAGMVAGAPQLELCDEAVMNWSPRGCQALGDCITPPPSLPYTCYWPH